MSMTYFVYFNLSGSVLIVRCCITELFVKWSFTLQ